MSIWSRLWGRKAGTILSSLPDILRYPDARSGVAVSPSTAIEVATVLACVRAIAEGVSQVPIRFYQGGQDGRRVPVWGHPLARVLNRRPNAWQTGFEFREMMAFHAVLTGNAFAYISRVGNRVDELIPVEPGRVTVERQADMTLRYWVRWEDGRSTILAASDVWHLRGPSWNGWNGLSAVRLAREAIGLALATELSHADLHRNGVQVSGLYSVSEKLSPEQFIKLRDWVVANSSGVNSGKPLILDQGATFTPTAMKGVDAQHIETRKHQIEEICRAFRVLPIMVGHSDKTATYASAEQMFLAHVVHTITPWATRIEESAEANLLAPGEEIEIEHDLKNLMRGAAKDRAEYFAKALGAGGSPAWMTPNEVRAEEGQDWIEGGDELPKPAAMTAPAAPGGANANA